MRSHAPRRGRPGTPLRRRPALEGLEARELPSSALSASASAAGRAAVRHASAIVAHPDSPSGLIGKKAPGTFLNPKVLRQAADDLYTAEVPPGTPTNREIRRQIFTARWVGQYTIGAPRFTVRYRDLPAGESRSDADAWQPLRQPDHWSGLALRPELPPVGQYVGPRPQRDTACRYGARRVADSTIVDL
jgi:hypothetical protein